MEVKIMNATNGYIIEWESEYTDVQPGEKPTFTERQVFEKPDIPPVKDNDESLSESVAMRNLLYAIMDKMDYYGSKYGYKLELVIRNSEWEEVNEEGKTVKID